MAKLISDKYEIIITPIYGGNNWEYKFEFNYIGLPIYNPNIFKSEIIASEYEDGSLLGFFIEAGKASDNGDKDSWNGWDHEVKINSKFLTFFADREKKDDEDEEKGITELEFLFQNSFLKKSADVVSSYALSVKIDVYRKQLKEFAASLEEERKSLAV